MCLGVSHRLCDREAEYVARDAAQERCRSVAASITMSRDGIIQQVRGNRATPGAVPRQVILRARYGVPRCHVRGEEEHPTRNGQVGSTTSGWIVHDRTGCGSEDDCAEQRLVQHEVSPDGLGDEGGYRVGSSPRQIRCCTSRDSRSELASRRSVDGITLEHFALTAHDEHKGPARIVERIEPRVEIIPAHGPQGRRQPQPRSERWRHCCHSARTIEGDRSFAHLRAGSLDRGEQPNEERENAQERTAEVSHGWDSREVLRRGIRDGADYRLN